MTIRQAGVRTSGSAQVRRSTLLNLIRDRGRLRVAGAAATLGVSQETLRRDLRLLEAQGLVVRTYGHVAPVESSAFETHLGERRGINPQEKSRIASAVVNHFDVAEILFIDEGFQTQLIAHAMPEDRHFTVVTASVPIATILAPKPNVNVLMLGGRVRGNTLGIVGEQTVDQLRNLNIDLAIIGANGVSVDQGLTTPDPAVAAVKGTAVQRARRRIFVGAHHKFGRSTFVRFADIADFEMLVTGVDLPPRQARVFSGLGPRLVRV